MPIISIIIPVYNEASVIDFTLKRLLSTLAPFAYEIIVVDGGSTDNTLSIVKKYPVKAFSSKEKSRAAQMNYGARYATGKRLLFLHSDTQLPKEFFTLICKIETMHWGFFRIKLDGRHRLFRLIETMINIRSTLTSVATGDQCMVISKTLFEQLDGFKNIPLMEDIEISKRLRKRYKPIVFKQYAITSSRRWEENGILKTILLMWKLRFYYFIGIPSEKLAKKYYA
jgi:rSAM/selenodomain-associated transferase 2